MQRRTGIFRNLNLEQHLEIFREGHVGGVHIPEALDPHFLALLQREMRGLERGGLLRKDPEVEGPTRVIQNSSSFNLGGWGMGTVPLAHVIMEDLPFSSILSREYATSIYNYFAVNVGFPTVPIMNAVNFRKYPGEGRGLTSHRDETTSTHLVGVVDVEGNCMFQMTFERHAALPAPFEMHPGDIVIMRANERPNRKGRPDVSPDLRTFHAVQSVGEDRYSIVLRNRAPR